MTRSPEYKKILDQLKKEAEDSVFVDVSKGKELLMGISQTRLNMAINTLISEGPYVRYYVRTTQTGSGKTVTITALAKRGTTYEDILKDMSKVPAQ